MRELAGGHRFGYAQRMTKRVLAANIVALRASMGLNQAAFAEKLGVGQPYISKWERGVEPSGARLATMAEWAGVSVRSFSHDPWEAPQAADHAPTRSADAGETASVMRMDLSFAMGSGTNIDEHYVEGEPVVFDISFLRRLTPSPPSLLRIVSGVGDSMQPTIHDSEELILDLGQRVLNLQDRIWAMSLFGVGAVKRLQVVGKDRVLVISDNPDVPDREVSTEDLIIVGRIVGSVKRH